MRGLLRILRAAAAVLLLVTLLVLGWQWLHAPAARLADGSRYQGPLVAGLMHGTGRLEWPDGSYYEGQFVRGELAGTGRLVTASGDVYQGGFRRGQMHGTGLMELASGGSLQGEFADDQLRHGAMVDHTGLLYEGEFEHGLLHGLGRQLWPDGMEMHGRFVRGELQSGQLRDTQGTLYQGDFVDWRLSGEGARVDAQGNEFRGHFVDGLLSGEGVFIGQNGTRYEGEFRRGMLHGQGRLTQADGSYYEGAFARDQRHGEGREFDASGQLLREGQWQSGQFWPDVLAHQQGLGEQVEALLYSQSDLLDTMLAAVQPSLPERINLYLLSIAGDGSQEVFRREVQYVEEMFRHWFDTDSRSITLINSRSTTGSYPLATITSVRRSLARLAEQMDVERDILFVFMTSHGSQDHRFQLHQNGLTLPALPADTLASLLAESGIRWQVVLISACYSGGFIEPLQNEHTLVITAARADRTSFGCTDEADFTYFGGAYFRDTLAADGDFVAAFHAARERVLAREEQEGIKVPSEPQIHMPEAVLAQLRAWQAQRE